MFRGGLQPPWTACQRKILLTGMEAEPEGERVHCVQLRGHCVKPGGHRVQPGVIVYNQGSLCTSGVIVKYVYHT